MAYQALFPFLAAVAGLLILVKGADFLIKGAVGLSRRLGISPLIIGLTIVAFGTSLPEFTVSLFSVLSGKADVSVGTIIGANINNLGIGIGLCALIGGLAIKSKSLIYEIPFLLVANFFLLILGNDLYIHNQNLFMLDRVDGFLFVAVFIVFIIYIIRSIQKNKKVVREEYNEAYRLKEPVWKSGLMVAAGLAGLVLGGKLAIEAALGVGEILQLSDSFVGLLIAIFGTTLPETITSVTAALRKHTDIAVGNIVGSNIFNVLFALGVPSLIRPITVNPMVLVIDGIVLGAMTLLFLFFATTSRKIERWEGGVLVGLYLVYFAFIIWRH